MPIKDPIKRKEYFKNYMANQRKGLIVKPVAVKPAPVLLNPQEVVKPKAEMLNPELVKPVKPSSEIKPPVNTKPTFKCRPCQKEPDPGEFFHCTLCSNPECFRSQIKQTTPFYCDFCWNKQEFYLPCWKCKAPQLKSGIF